MKFKIATPERIMLETEVDSVSLPTTLGEITVLPHHIPLVANLVPGEIHYKHNGQQNFFAVSGGIVEVKDKGEVIVLADTAEFAHEIDVHRAEAAKEAAKKLMAEPNRDDQAFAQAAAMIEKNAARIRLVKKHRTHTHQNLESGTLKE